MTSTDLVSVVQIVKEIQATIPLEFDFLREVWFMVNYIYLGC
jgi:hypothetical protein